MDSNQTAYKTCSRCKEAKPLDRFHKHKDRRDGLNGYCIDCQSAYHKAYINQRRTGERKQVLIRRKGVVSSDRMCSICKQLKPISEFWKHKGRGDGLDSQCKSCKSSRQNEMGYIESLHLVRAARRDKRKRELVEIFGGSCNRCGYNEFDTALTFHHVNPDTKELSPAIAIYRNDLDKVYREIDKCILLCSNCHFALEAGLWKGEFVKRDGLGYALKVITT